MYYDTIFQLGTFCGSPLIFRHTVFKERPCIPAMFFTHKRKLKHTRKCLQRVWSRSQQPRKLHAQTGRRLNDQCHTSWGSTGPLLEPHSQRHPVLAKTAWSTCHRCQLVSTWTSFPLLYQGCLWWATQWDMKNLVCHLWAVLHDQYYMTNIEPRFSWKTSFGGAWHRSTIPTVG